MNTTDLLDRRKSISCTAAAARLGLHHRTLRRYAAAKIIPGAYRIGKRGKWRFRVDVLAEWLDEQHKPVPKPIPKQRMTSKPLWARGII